MKTISKKGENENGTANRMNNRVGILLVISLIFVMILSAVTDATVAQESKKMTRKEKEAAWRAERLKKRAEEKAEEMRNDSIEFLQTIEAIKEGSWALEASSITFDNGVTRFVTPSTNFLSMNEGTGVVQTAFDNSNIYSPNGIGGVTLEGRITGEEVNMDNDGNVTYNYTIMGPQLSATVNIVISGYSNQATATVSPNFSSNDMTMSGSIYPYSSAGIFEGTTGY